MSDAQPTPPDGYDADANGEWVDPANDDASIFNKPPDLAKTSKSKLFIVLYSDCIWSVVKPCSILSL